MLGQALALTLLLLITGHQGQDSAEHVAGLSGESVWLRPLSTQMKTYSVHWKMKPPSDLSYLILNWKNNSGVIHVEQPLDRFKNRLNFMIEDLTLHIKEAQQQDSGLYSVEVTSDTGMVWRQKFQVSVFDHVEKPSLLEKKKTLDRGICQVTLFCLVSGGGDVDVSYTWYKGTELIQTPRNLTELEVQIDADGLHIYTCNVSNPVSWANHTLELTQGCQSGHRNFILLTVLVSVVFLLMALFLITFTCWRRKRKQSQTSPEEVLTIYEDVNHMQVRRQQEQKPNSPGAGNTIYSVIQSQSSASTSQETANTLYSLVQSSWKSGSKKRSPSPSFSKTIYEEVGNRASKAKNPARLSRRELENFCVYS
ncbi:natural killer cell receptor 2B4 isoform X1 [Camelus bactrianus]|uniref:Natural killer cell receptor 2B4 n=2 Tax=Camelus bactrianus TaxID=9837 RepID=A0A9W3ER04_CAMBA|nr:natural killer cell receptor 2B4 [Camelus bactrianus]